MKIVNRKARRNYHILETLEAGVVLNGLEVKSVKAGKVDLNEGFARIVNNELLLKNVYIYPYQKQVFSEDPRRDRKLLIHTSQMEVLRGKLSGGPMALIPLSMYVTRNLIKVELALAASKSKFDQRRAIKLKDEQRRIEQEMGWVLALNMIIYTSRGRMIRWGSTLKTASRWRNLQALKMVSKPNGAYTLRDDVVKAVKGFGTGLTAFIGGNQTAAYAVA